MKIRMIYARMGVILGIISITLGIVFFVTPPESFSTSSVDRVAFGGDFYTEEYAATRAAVSNAAVTANNIREIGEKNSKYVGTFFLLYGFMMLINYGEKYELIKEELSTSSNNTLKEEHRNEQKTVVINNSDLSMDDAEKEIKKYIILFDKGLIDEKELNRKRDDILCRVKM